MSRWWSKNSAKIVHQRVGQDLKCVIIIWKYILKWISSTKFGVLQWGVLIYFWTFVPHIEMYWYRLQTTDKTLSTPSSPIQYIHIYLCIHLNSLWLAHEYGILKQNTVAALFVCTASLSWSLIFIKCCQQGPLTRLENNHLPRVVTRLWHR